MRMPDVRVFRSGPDTARLRHRAMTPDDGEAFFALNSNPDVMRYTGEPAIGSLDEAKHALASYPDFEKHGFGRWGCELKRTGELIGFCGLKRLDEFDGEVDVGFRFLPEHWGKGLATEACAASLAFGFETLGLDRIIALVLPENAASVRVLDKCGMRYTGMVRTDGVDALRYVCERRGEVQFA